MGILRLLRTDHPLALTLSGVPAISFQWNHPNELVDSIGLNADPRGSPYCDGSVELQCTYEK